MHSSKLARFMVANGITVEALAEESGLSVRLIYYLRQGATPRLTSAVEVAHACSVLSRRRVDLHQLFNLQSARKRLEKAS